MNGPMVTGCCPAREWFGYPVAGITEEVAGCGCRVIGAAGFNCYCKHLFFSVLFPIVFVPQRRDFFYVNSIHPIVAGNYSHVRKIFYFTG